MYLLFDIGATKTRVCLGENSQLINPLSFSTPEHFEELLEHMKRAKGTHKISKIVGGVAGPLDESKSILIHSSNLPKAWSGMNITKKLSESFGVPVVLENDAAIVGLGEAVHGSGKGKKIVAYVTVSTGVGGALIINGNIAPSALGFEPGHQIIASNRRKCPGCAGFDHLESYVSGKAIREYYQIDPAQITDEKIWREIAYFLAVGLNNIAVHWSPNVIVLGGSVMKSLPLHLIEQELSKLLCIFKSTPPILPRTLEDIGGLYGAMVLASYNVFK